MSDIMDAFAQLRVMFRRENLEVPTAIQLASHEDGMRFLSLIRQQPCWTAMIGDPSLGSVVEMADGSAYMQVEVMDIKVRWPANRIATPDGSWSYV